MKTINYLSKLFLAIAMIGFSQWANAQEEIFKETFDNLSGYSLANPNSIPLVLENAATDNPGWSGEGCYEAGGAIKLGSKGSIGEITTPEIDLSDPTATYTLTVNASSWNKKYSVIYVQVDGEDVYEISGLENSSDYENTLKNQFFTITLPTGTTTSKVTFTNKVKDKAYFLDNIVITKAGGSGVELEDPKCAFSAETATYTLGEAFTAPTFTTVSDGEVTYKSSNTDVATVDNSGNITAIAAGTTTITASVGVTDTYKPGSASYTLTVIDPSILFSESFAESLGDFTVTQTEEVWTYNSEYKCAYANGFNKEDGQDLKLISPIINLKDVTDAYLTFEHAAGYATDHNLQTEVTLWIKEKDATEWSQLIIPVYPDSWTFVNSGEISLNAYCGKEVQIAFNYTWQKKFAAAWEIKNVIIKKAEPATLTISVSDAGYATYFTDKAWVVADNMKAGIVTGVENKNLTIDWKYAAGSVVPANTAVLIQADAKEYVCEVSNSEEEAPANNLLKGSTTAATTEGENCLFYKLSYDNDGKNLGFYWAAENGAAFTNEANKAYLALTTAVAQNVRGFGLEGDGTTGIGQVENGEALVNVYTIDGIIVRKQVKESQALNDLKKGIYIVNGKKVIK